MSIDYNTLNLLRHNHPAWRLLISSQAPLVAGFFHRVFIEPNVRTMAQADLAEALEDELYALRESMGDDAFSTTKSALDYLNEWAADDKAWLRKFYRLESDEPYFDLTPATEKAITWLGSLTARSFVGTESRLLTLFDLLKQMDEGSTTDPQTRIAELHKRRAEIDAEIARIVDGDIPLLDATAIKERFAQFTTLSRELLADFREVEHNFRLLDRRVRERIALWDGSKGALLQEIFGERDSISESDQGRSFRAFWDFLMSQHRQDELTARLERILALPAVVATQPDRRLHRIHYDWLEAGEVTQRTVAQLSQQLRRFLDNKAWLENRRIMDVLRHIESAAIAVRDTPPTGAFMTIDEMAARVELPLERPLYTPAPRPRLLDQVLDAADIAIDADALFSQIVIDNERLAHAIRHTLQGRSQVTLREVVDAHPLQHGLAELVALLQLASAKFKSVVDEDAHDVIVWRSADRNDRDVYRQARLPRVIIIN